MASKSGGKQSGNKSETQSLNIQSYIRVRPLAPKEKRSVNLEFTRKEISIKSPSDARTSKVFTFDRVFEEDAKQVTVYTTIVRPMIKEIIQGYNCTVFAYGQTGTGKTYTMSGCDVNSWEDNIHAGIIPRALDDIFGELSAKSCEFQVSISFMELYNEKLRNLLNELDDEPNIQLIDDLEGGVLLKGLSPTPVKNKEEAFQLLLKGAERKHVAATLLNVNSSRSHTIVTVSIKMKEGTLDKDDVVRVAKLHLVDLAGSENVSKSGASEKIHKSACGTNRRLTEASNINRSLLTLGRVITSITENNPHIPYRESKLTRLLRDSLGGKMKTCIIGTVSPSHANLDETESTINYASKARSIKNKPEKNQTISKREFMQVASEEILKLKRDLEAHRQGDGFYISKESHEEMTSHIKNLDIQVKNWYERYNLISTQYEQSKEQFISLNEDYDVKCAEYEELDRLFKAECDKLQKRIEDVKREIVVREYLIDQYKKTEKNLTDQAKQCRSVLENILEQNDRLHSKMEDQKKMESLNAKALEDFKADIKHKLEEAERRIMTFYSQEKSFIKKVNKSAVSLCDSINSGFGEINSVIQDYREQANASLLLTRTYTEEMKKVLDQSMDKEVQKVKGIFQNHCNILDSMMYSFNEGMNAVRLKMDNTVKDASGLIHNLEDMLNDPHIEDNLKSIQDCLHRISLGILDKFAPIECQMNHALELANQSRISCENAYQKVKRIKGDIEDLEVGMENTYKSAEASQINLESVKGNFTQSKQGVLNLIEEEACLTTGFSESILNKIKTFVLHQDQTCSQLARQLSAVKESVGSLESRFNTQSESLSRAIAFEDKNCDENIRSVIDYDKLLGDMNETAQKTFDRSIQYWDTNTNSIKGVEEKLEEKLRHNQATVCGNLSLTTLHKNLSLESIGEIQGFIQEMNYTASRHDGTTPKKITRDDLDYPKSFDSTSAREVLLKNMPRELNQELKSHRSSETIECHQSSSSENIVTLNPRRSSSLPDIYSPDRVIEDKENISSQTLDNKKKKLSTRSHGKTFSSRPVLSESNNKRQVLTETKNTRRVLSETNNTQQIISEPNSITNCNNNS